MTTSLPAVQPGYVRSALSTQALRRVLSGNQSLEDALMDGGITPAQYIHHSRVVPRTVVGFIPPYEQPREVIVARLPFTQTMIPVEALRPAGRYWEPNPQLVSRTYLLRHEGIALKADWLDYLVDLAETLANSKSPLLGVDRVLLAIGAAWDWWEKDNIPWLDRCRDLARITHSSELAPNTLLKTCKRHGLVRRDKIDD